MKKLTEEQLKEVVDYIQKNSTVVHNGIDFIGCGRKKELQKVRFYARLSVPLHNHMFKGFSKDNWEDILMYVVINNDIKKYTFNLAFSYLIEEILSGYKDGKFSDLNPSTLYILPYKESKTLHIYVEIETFTFKYTPSIE